ncbi:MAG: glycosyltransferase [Deltaproteobacteria bacterium]|nr:glycosyltransferase [Deltaproteobacteria bacterium]
MRRLLLISPCFPPQSRVGALRPLKFARHMTQHGWVPAVLADLWSGTATDPDLLAAVPDSTIVVRDYSRRATPAFAAFEAASRRPAPAEAPRVRGPSQRGENASPRWLPALLDNPELIPLGEHAPRMPYALRAARRVLERYPCDAIMVNADPFAACLVGARLKRETGLPLIIDLRDPWALCELRRPMRPLPIRALIDRLERDVVRTADRVILNTETTLQDYRAHYPDLPPERFTCIRNHADRELIGHGSHPGFDRYTLLFLGNFGRFIKADVLIRVLAELRRRGIDEKSVQLVVTGNFPETSWRMAQGMGVAAMIHLHTHVPYRQIGAIMDAADLLVLLIQPRGRQRLAAKLFDYLVSERPVLAISESVELRDLLARSGAGSAFDYAEISAIADHIASEIAAGRGRRVTRNAVGATSEEATAALCGHLDAIVGAT